MVGKIYPHYCEGKEILCFWHAQGFRVQATTHLTTKGRWGAIIRVAILTYKQMEQQKQR